MRSKTFCVARSASGSRASTRGSSRGSAVFTSYGELVRTASMLALPQTPHEEVV